MEQVYIDTAKMLRAMSDPKRLRIVDMLSCGEMCACKILEKFQIRDGKNIYYSLNHEALTVMHQTLGRMFEDKPDCICHQSSRSD